MTESSPPPFTVHSYAALECSVCHEWKLSTCFYRDSSRKRGFYPACKACRYKVDKDYAARRDADPARRARRLKSYRAYHARLKAKKKMLKKGQA